MAMSLKAACSATYAPSLSDMHCSFLAVSIQ